MSEPTDDVRVFDFTRSDWVRSGAFSSEHFERILGSIARGERIAFTTKAWLALARLGQDYAQAVWERFGDRWLVSFERMREGADFNAPGLGGLEAYERARQLFAANIRELRRLAGLEQLDLPE